MEREFIWSQKYRPNTVEDCILPDEIKQPFLSYVKSGELPNLLLSGGPGVGKSTLAQAVCKQLDYDYMFIPGSEETGVDLFRGKIKSFSSSLAFNGKRKVVIIDEADYLSPNAQAAFRGALEQYSKNTSFILTCNFPAKIIPAISESRCTHIEFRIKNGQKVKMAKQFLTRIKTILDQEAVPYEIPVLAEIIQTNFPDFRKTINELQKFASFGKGIDTGILSFIKDIAIDDLLVALKNKNVPETRKWLVNNLEDSASLFRKIYDALQSKIKPATIPQAILLLAKYQYQDAFAADKEINVMAFLIDFMMEVEFV